jgi:hypothetical protein
MIDLKVQERNMITKAQLATTSTEENDTMARREPEGSTRAARFLVQLPVRYRTADSTEWHEARTENVSHTGVLFRTKSILKPSTMVDVRLEVPPTRADGSHAEVICKCEVVRVDKKTRGNKNSPALAFAIRNYRFTRKQEPN